MNSVTTVKATQAKNPFEQRWKALAPEAQDRFYRMKCRELLSAPRYSNLTHVERSSVLFMRDNMKKMPNGKEHPKVEPLMSC